MGEQALHAQGCMYGRVPRRSSDRSEIDSTASPADNSHLRLKAAVCCMGEGSPVAELHAYGRIRCPVCGRPSPWSKVNCFMGGAQIWQWWWPPADPSRRSSALPRIQIPTPRASGRLSEKHASSSWNSEPV